VADDGTKNNVLEPAETGEEDFTARGTIESLTARDFPSRLPHVSGNPQHYFKGLSYLE